MRILIAGGTGFIGIALVQFLLERHYQLVILTRNSASPSMLHYRQDANITVAQWDAQSADSVLPPVDSCDVVVNLAGEPIAAHRWTERQKIKIMQSRIETTGALVEAINKSSHPPGTLINASAVGYYGNIPEGDVAENHPAGSDFLSSVCVQWEREAMRAESSGRRVVMLRSGVVLDTKGGAFQKMILPFRFFLGGYQGSGMQWFPWIHIRDELCSIMFAIENKNISGALNLASPCGVRSKEFCSILGHTMHRPSWIPAPAFAIKLVIGEMADMVLTGQKVVPAKLLDNGFRFQFSDCEEAVRDLLLNKSGS